MKPSTSAFPEFLRLEVMFNKVLERKRELVGVCKGLQCLNLQWVKINLIPFGFAVNKHLTVVDKHDRHRVFLFVIAKINGAVVGQIGFRQNGEVVFAVNHQVNLFFREAGFLNANIFGFSPLLDFISRLELAVGVNPVLGRKASRKYHE